MNQLITEDQADKTKDVFVGMWRPPLAEVLSQVKVGSEMFDGYWFTGKDRRGSLKDGKAYGFFADEARVKECWLMGDFDSALYKRIID